VVLTGEHCYPSGPWKAETRDDRPSKKKEKKQKSISRYFPGNPHVLLVDDCLEATVAADRGRVVLVSSWTADPADTELRDLVLDPTRGEEEKTEEQGSDVERRVCAVKARLARNGEQRQTRRVTAWNRYMNDDARFQAGTPEGAELLTGWDGGTTAGVAAVRGFQGCGKTTWWTKLAVDLIYRKPGAKVVVIGPFTTLMTAITEDMRKRVREKIVHDMQHKIGTQCKIHVHFYKDPLPTDDAYDILVACPRSLFKFEFTDVELMVVDELSAINEQLLNWGGNPDAQTASSLARSIDVLRSLAMRTNRLLLSGAQADMLERETFLAMVGIPPTVPLTLYDHGSKGHRTPVNVLTCIGDFVGRVDRAVVAKERCAVNVRTASTAWTLQRTLEKLASERSEGDSSSSSTPSRQPVIVVIDAKWLAEQKDNPSKDFTGWLTAKDVDVLIYTNAVGPGNNIAHMIGYWTHRFQLLTATGAGAGVKVLAQMMNRIRHVEDRTVVMLLVDVPAQVAAATAERQTCTQLAVSRHPAQRQTRIAAGGRCETVLCPGIANDLCLLRIHADLARRGRIGADEIIAQMDNAFRVVPSSAVTLPVPPDWAEAVQEQRERTAKHVCWHFTDEEVAKVAAEREDKNYMLLTARAQRYHWIANNVPPECIHAAGHRLGTNSL
jgi:hypothetical protein